MKLLLKALPLLALASVLSAPANAGPNPAREDYFDQHGIPPQDAPIHGDQGIVLDVAKANDLYQSYCMGCHGVNGAGDGDAAGYFPMQPPNFADTIAQDHISNDYLFWAIQEGGKAFGSPMPSFKTKLSTEETWQLIELIRAGMPKP